MSFSDLYVTRRTRKNHPLLAMEKLIDWVALDRVIHSHYAPVSDAAGRPAYSGLLLFKMLLVGIWYGGLSDERVEAMANENLSVMRFLGLSLEDDVPDHSVLSRFRTRLTEARAWDSLLDAVNRQFDLHGVNLKRGVHVDASLTISPRKPKHRPTYEVVDERSATTDEPEASKFMQVMEVIEAGVDAEARWTKKAGKHQFGYKQHVLVNDDGLVLHVASTPANTHDSKALPQLLERSKLPPKTRVHADKAYTGKFHSELLKSLQLKNGIQDKAVRGKPLSARQHQRNTLITKVRYVVERTFGSQVRWFGSKVLRYCGLAKAHAWHVLQAMAYNMKRLPNLRWTG